MKKSKFLPSMQGFLGLSKSSKPPDPVASNSSKQITAEQSSQTTKRVRTASASSEFSCPSIATSNSYSSLEDDVEEPTVTSGRTTKKAKRSIPNSQKTIKINNKVIEPSLLKKTPLPPPITVKNKTILQLNEALNGLSMPKEEMTLKLTQYGIKVFTTNSTNFTALKQHLISKKVEFFTHQSREERLSKFVLYGLIEWETQDVLKELNRKNLFPTEVKKLKVKHTRYDLESNFILYFKKTDNIKLAQLREIKTLFQLIVSWDHYKYKHTRITICSICQSFGHGSQNCHVNPICIKCAGSHASKNCPLDSKKDDKGKIPERYLYCVHCTHHHTANYSKCPKRLEYIARLKSLKSTRKSNRQSFVKAPELNDFNFPSISNHYKPNVPAWINQSEFANAPSHIPTKNEDLFSPNECFNIFKEFLSKISQCSSKVQQIETIAEITFKYLK